MRQCAVVGQQQQSARVDVETTDDDPAAAGQPRQAVEARRPPFRIAPRAHHAVGLVHDQNARGGFGAMMQRCTIDGDLVVVTDARAQRSQRSPLTVTRPASIQRSISRREPRPASAITLWSFSVFAGFDGRRRRRVAAALCARSGLFSPLLFRARRRNEIISDRPRFVVRRSTRLRPTSRYPTGNSTRGPSTYSGPAPASSASIGSISARISGSVGNSSRLFRLK